MYKPMQKISERYYGVDSLDWIHRDTLSQLEAISITVGLDPGFYKGIVADSLENPKFDLSKLESIMEKLFPDCKEQELLELQLELTTDYQQVSELVRRAHIAGTLSSFESTESIFDQAYITEKYLDWAIDKVHLPQAFITSIKSRGKNTDASGKELTSLYKIILGVATKKYSYDPNLKGRQSATGSNSGSISYDTGVSNKTIRKILREAHIHLKNMN